MSQSSITTLLRTSLLFGLLFTTSEASAAGRVFYDGSEAGNTNLWVNGSDGRDSCVSVTSGVGGATPYAGSRMISCNWNGLVDGGVSNSYETLRLNNLNFTSEMFYRTMLRCGSDKDPADGAKFIRIGAFNAGGDMTAPVFTADGGVIVSFWGQSGELDNATEYLSDICSSHTWHKFEMYIREHSSTGQVKVWIDDVLEYDHSGDTTQTTGIWDFYMMSNWSSNPGWEHDANNHLYWDEFELFTDLGTGGAGSLSAGTITQGGTDTTPPAAPTGLGVN